METQIKEYSITEAALGELRVRLAGAKYEVATTAGMETARRDRRELVTLRTSLEAKRKEIKAPALAHCKLIDDEARRITVEITALETPIDDQIKAEEAKREAEKAEKARIAAEAQKVLDDKIIEIGKLPLRCLGKTADEIALFLATLEAREIGGEFAGETRERAEAAKKEAVEEIRNLHAAAQEAEQMEADRKAHEAEEAARLEEERKERERLAAIEREAIVKQQAELTEKQWLQDIEAEKFRAEQAAFKAEQDRINAERAEEERVERAKLEAEEARLRAEKEKAARIQREKEAEERRQAEAKAAAAEVARKKAEKQLKLAAAKCKDAATAFKKILDICQDKAEDAIEQIALIAEAML